MPDSDLLRWLAETLVRYGPAVLFFSCLLETAVFIGLVVPVGALIAFSAMLSSRGVFPPEQIVFAALSGAWIGDQIGFAVGRWFLSSARPPKGEIARIWRGALGRAETLLGGRRSWGISAARGIPFVRTIMPWLAGRSGIGWPRFVFFDIGGVLLWGAIYIGGGFAAGQGWQQIAGQFGEAVAGIVLLVVFVAIALATRTRFKDWLRGKRRRRAKAGVE